MSNNRREQASNACPDIEFKTCAHICSFNPSKVLLMQVLLLAHFPMRKQQYREFGNFLDVT